MAEDREETSVHGSDGGAQWALSSARPETAEAYLKAQIRLALLQADDLEREDAVRHWSLRVRHVSDVLKLGLELAAAAIVLAIAIFIGGAVWSAAHDNGLVIEAFNVPSDVAAKGLTGEVIATQVQDRLAWMQANTDTIRQSSAYRRDFGDEIKVQIPDTGVSVAEFYRYLGNWLGHQTHITGEVWRTGNGFALSVRSGQNGASNFQGGEGDLAALVNDAAEQIYWQTQPYRYATFLGQHGRLAQSEKLLDAMADHGAAEDRPWALSRIGTQVLIEGHTARSVWLQKKAAELGPDLPHIWGNLANAEGTLGHESDMVAHFRRALVLLENPATAQQLSQAAVHADIAADRAIIDETFGDYRSAIALEEPLERMPVYSQSDLTGRLMRSADLALNHDIAGSIRTDRDSEAHGVTQYASANFLALNPPLPVYERAMARGDWKTAVSDMQALFRVPVMRSDAMKSPIVAWLWPQLALAQAKSGDIAGARVSAAHALQNCAFCDRVRGDIEAEAHNWQAAARLFTASNTFSPGPFADTDWGAMLMAKGHLSGAIAKFESAHKKGPHFADPLEMWGEALMLQDRSDLALAKFEEANRDAPNWGRLHLKWGEALFYAGNKDEARKQFATAATLFLNPAEKADRSRAIAKL